MVGRKTKKRILLVVKQAVKQESASTCSRSFLSSRKQCDHHQHLSFLVCTLSQPTSDQLAAAFKVLVVQKYLGTCHDDMIREVDHNCSVMYVYYVYVSG